MLQMRNSLVMAGLAAVLTLTMLWPSARAVEVRHFAGQSTGDLMALCSATEEAQHHMEALQFCYGLVAGVIQLHNDLAGRGLIEPIACPGDTTTRKDAVDALVSWVSRNPTMMALPAAEGVMRAMDDAFPCP